MLNSWLLRLRISCPLALCIVALVAMNGAAYAVQVNSLTPIPVVNDNEWYASPITGPTPGTASIVNLTGMGGNLEFFQPAGVGAARLTTGFDNNDRAGMTYKNTTTSFGSASLVLSDIDLEYWFHKVFVPAGNAAAAPSI